MIQRPLPNEYAAYYERYISQISSDQIESALANQAEQMHTLVAPISVEDETFRYAEGKWSIRELIGHLIDGERIFGYRLLRISRHDSTPLPGYDDDGFARCHYDKLPLARLIEEFDLVRRANIMLYQPLTTEDLAFIGNANTYPVSARAILFIMAGHVKHHLNVLREMYLTKLQG